ncbi:MAG: hypothetical protein ACI8XX_000745 [Polaribacter sp.]|jgi:hypothetical protein
MGKLNQKSSVLSTSNASAILSSQNKIKFPVPKFSTNINQPVITNRSYRIASLSAQLGVTLQGHLHRQ